MKQYPFDEIREYLNRRYQEAVERQTQSCNCCPDSGRDQAYGIESFIDDLRYEFDYLGN